MGGRKTKDVQVDEAILEELREIRRLLEEILDAIETPAQPQVASIELVPSPPFPSS